MGPTGMSLSGLGSDLATLCNKHFAILDIFNYFLCVCVYVCAGTHCGVPAASVQHPSWLAILSNILTLCVCQLIFLAFEMSDKNLR